MAAEKFVTVEEESELADVLREATRGPVIALFDGKRFRISAERDPRLPVVDPDAALAAFDRAFGILKDDPEYDAQEENTKIREWRDLDRWPGEDDE